MLYNAYQFQDDIAALWRLTARSMMGAGDALFGGWGDAAKRRMLAGLEMISRFEITHKSPDFDINSVMVGNRDVPVTIRTACEMPFGKLLHFTKDIDSPQPRVLVVAPLSGHFSTLLRSTVQTLLREAGVSLREVGL